MKPAIKDKFAYCIVLSRFSLPLAILDLSYKKKNEQTSEDNYPSEQIT
jgi:hypothetical protein